MSVGGELAMFPEGSYMAPLQALGPWYANPLVLSSLSGSIERAPELVRFLSPTMAALSLFMRAQNDIRPLFMRDGTFCHFTLLRYLPYVHHP